MAVFNVLLAVYVIRALGATEYGKFSIALSFVFLFSTLFDFGLSTAVTREFSLEPNDQKHFPAILTLKTLFGLGLTALITGLSFLTKSDPVIRNATIILCIYGFAMEGTYLFYSLARARQQMEIEAAFRVLQILLLVLLVAVAMWVNRSVLALSAAYAGATSITLLSVALYFRHSCSVSLRPAFNAAIWRRFLLIGLYLALAKGAGDVMTYTDSVLLGYFGLVTETGMYNAVLKVNKLVLLPMAFITGALFPTLITILRESKEKFAKYYRLWMKGTIFFSVFVLFVILAAADRIILVVFPPEFLAATTALKLLTVMAVLVYINNVYYQILLICGQQKRLFYVILAASLINVILNLILIPRYGIDGAATATVVTYSTILCQYVFLSRKHTVINPIEPAFVLTLGAAIISGIVVWRGLSAMGGLNLFLAVFLATAIYALLFGGLSKMGRYLVPKVNPV
jgi:O-antigen/teichoic acid export membrane protein